MIIGKDKEGTLMLEAKNLEDAVKQIKQGYVVSVSADDSMSTQGLIQFGSQFRPQRFEEGNSPYITGVRGELGLYDTDAFLQTAERKGLDLELIRKDSSTRIYKVGGD
jgi:hypothetical protein